MVEEQHRPVPVSTWHGRSVWADANEKLAGKSRANRKRNSVNLDMQLLIAVKCMNAQSLMRDGANCASRSIDLAGFCPPNQPNGLAQ
jgi:hypothetical protein